MGEVLRVVQGVLVDVAMKSKNTNFWIAVSFDDPATNVLLAHLLIHNVPMCKLKKYREHFIDSKSEHKKESQTGKEFLGTRNMRLLQRSTMSKTRHDTHVQIFMKTTKYQQESEKKEKKSGRAQRDFQTRISEKG